MTLPPVDQLGLDFEARIGAGNLAAIERTALHVSQRATWTWEDVKAQLPDGVRQVLELATHTNTSGGISRQLARRYHWQIVGAVPSSDPKARGRRIALYAKEAA